MKLPDLPEEDPKKKPKSDQLPKHPPKVVVHRGGPAHQPGDEERKPASLFGTRPTPHPAPSRPAPSRPIPTITAVPPDPEAPTRTDLFQPVGDQTEAAPTATGAATSRRNGSTGKGINPGLRLRAFEAAARNAPPAKVPMKYLLRPNRELARKAYWDVAAALSLIVNAILVGVLLVMAVQLKNLKSTLNGLLGGLYGNFVLMDNAKINTTITVETQIPLSFSLPVSQNTNVTLTDSVNIRNAWVVINTGAMTINSAANVTLPAGTNLPIALNMDIPVQVSVPVSLQVPVNIPLNQTELHTPFSGLQQTIRPLYCSFNRNAQYPQGFFICAGHDTPTPTTP
jgi:hypothetical protein